jgi:hypothetical protein
MNDLKYFSSYPEEVRDKVSWLLQENRLGIICWRNIPAP